MAGNSGDGVLAQLTLTATTAGTASLSGANILLFDATGALIPVTPPTRQIQVIAAPIPLAAWMTLLLLLTLALLGARSFRSQA